MVVGHYASMQAAWNIKCMQSLFKYAVEKTFLVRFVCFCDFFDGFVLCCCMNCPPFNYIFSAQS